MKKIILVFAWFLPLILFNKKSEAQNGSTKYKLAIFAPLYLDSALDSMDNYRYAKNQFPEFINPGLEFYEGVQLA